MTDDLVGSPNCPVCLHPLHIAGTEQRPYWECLECGHIALAD